MTRQCTSNLKQLWQDQSKHIEKGDGLKNNMLAADTSQRNPSSRLPLHAPPYQNDVLREFVAQPPSSLSTHCPVCLAVSAGHCSRFTANSYEASLLPGWFLSRGLTTHSRRPCSHSLAFQTQEGPEIETASISHHDIILSAAVASSLLLLSLLTLQASDTSCNARPLVLQLSSRPLAAFCSCHYFQLMSRVVDRQMHTQFTPGGKTTALPK